MTNNNLVHKTNLKLYFTSMILPLSTSYSALSHWRSHYLLVLFCDWQNVLIHKTYKTIKDSGVHFHVHILCKVVFIFVSAKETLHTPCVLSLLKNAYLWKGWFGVGFGHTFSSSTEHIEFVNIQYGKYGTGMCMVCIFGPIRILRQSNE